MFDFFKKMISKLNSSQKSSSDNVELVSTSNLGQIEGLPNKDGGYDINDKITVTLGNDTINEVPLLTWAIMTNKDNLALDLIKKGADVNQEIPGKEITKAGYANSIGNPESRFGLAIEVAKYKGNKKIFEAISEKNTGQQTSTKEYLDFLKAEKSATTYNAAQAKYDTHVSSIHPFRKALTQAASAVKSCFRFKKNNSQSRDSDINIR